MNKEQRNQVALAIVTRYPHLKDPISSGLVSFLANFNATIDRDAGKGGRRGGFAPLALSQGGQGGGQKCPFINYSSLKMSKR